MSRPHPAAAEPPPRRLLTVDEVAAMLRVPVATVYFWRARGKGPRGRKVGKFVRYREQDVHAWLDAQADQW